MQYIQISLIKFENHWELFALERVLKSTSETSGTVYCGHQSLNDGSSIPALSSFSNYLGSKTKVLKNHLPGRVRISLAQGLFSLLSRFEESLFLALHIQTKSTCTYTQHTRMRVWPCKELWTAAFASFVLCPKTGSEFLRCDSMLFQFEPFSNSLQTSCVTALRLTQFIFTSRAANRQERAAQKTREIPLGDKPGFKTIGLLLLKIVYKSSRRCLLSVLYLGEAYTSVKTNN